MNDLIPKEAYSCLPISRRSTNSSSAAKPYAPYPWPDEEMIVRYGMRRSTPEEKKLFPTHRLALDVFRVKITKIAKSPYANPESGIGWVVWAVKSYPGSHQFRMLNGDLLHEQYHGVEWERVPEETACPRECVGAVTTPASVARLKAQQQWQRKVHQSIRQNLRL